MLIILGLQLLMFICFQQQKKPPSFFQNLESCQTHKNEYKFICLDARCKQQPLLCVECLLDHKQHRWQSLQKFFTPQIQEMFITGTSKTTAKIEQAQNTISRLFDSFKEKVDNQINRLQANIRGKLEVIRENNRIAMKGEQKINQRNTTSLLLVLEKEKSVEWIYNLKVFVQSTIEQVVKTIDSIVEDLEGSLGGEWQQRTGEQNEAALQEFKDHLHYHKEKDPDYFKFHKSLKHPGIILSEDLTQAIFQRSVPSRPVAITANYIQLNQNKLAFEIKKLDTTAFFFAASTIFVGVCNPNIVKSVGLRRISEVGKGAYMIGSSGWSYHHKDRRYDRQSVVGFGFSEGQTVIVEVDVKAGDINFSKQGKIFKYTFSMPLGLNQRQILELKPCVSFDGDQGAVVRILNLPQI